MRSFNDSIHQLLWPERRLRDAKFGNNLPGLIDRVGEPAYFIIPLAGYLPGCYPIHFGILELAGSWIIHKQRAEIRVHGHCDSRQQDHNEREGIIPPLNI